MISEVKIAETLKKGIKHLIEEELGHVDFLKNKSEKKAEKPSEKVEPNNNKLTENAFTQLQDIESISEPEKAPAPVLIETWLSDEGFNVHEHEKYYKEAYKFAFERETEKFHRNYLVEVCDFGRAIKKVKMRIV